MACHDRNACPLYGNQQTTVFTASNGFSWRLACHLQLYLFPTGCGGEGIPSRSLTIWLRSADLTRKQVDRYNARQQCEALWRVDPNGTMWWTVQPVAYDENVMSYRRQRIRQHTPKHLAFPQPASTGAGRDNRSAASIDFARSLAIDVSNGSKLNFHRTHFSKCVSLDVTFNTGGNHESEKNCWV